MFEEYYGFTATPFTRNLPVDRLFTTPQQEEVLARLAYAAERRWFAVLTGDCGSGKSTFARLVNALNTPTSGALRVAGMDTAVEKNQLYQRCYAQVLPMSAEQAYDYYKQH